MRGLLNVVFAIACMFTMTSLHASNMKTIENEFSDSVITTKITSKYTENKNLVISKNTSDSRKTWFCSKEQKLL